MKTYRIQSNAVGHMVVDHTGEQHGIFGSQSEAEAKLRELERAQHTSKAVPVFTETKLEKPKPKVVHKTVHKTHKPIFKGKKR